MNQVILIGRLTRDPEIWYSKDKLPITSFSVAIDRGKDRDGKDKGADFPSVTAFGKTAELCDRYLRKGLKVAVQGRIQTGSYVNKEGKTVYTTDVVADRVEFLEWAADQPAEKDPKEAQPAPDQQEFIPLGDDELPF